MQSTRADKKCGASYIPNTAKCTKGSGVGTAVKAVATAGVIAGGAAALKRRKTPSLITMKMTPTLGLKASRATATGLRRHKAAVIKGERRHKVAVKKALSKGSRRHKAAVLKARRKYEPGFMKKTSKRRGLGSFYKDGHKQTGYVRDRLAKIMDGMRKPKY
jgi:hypothetical protein